MKTLTHAAAAALALAGGTVALVAAMPAAAAKKKDEAPSSGLKPTPAFIKVAQPIEAALKANQDATALLPAAQAAATSDDDKYILANFTRVNESRKIEAAQQAGQRPDMTAFRAATEAMITNPKTPPADLAALNLTMGRLTFDERKYPDSIRYLTAARTAGRNDAGTLELLSKAKYLSGDAAGGSADLEASLAARPAGEKAQEQLYRYAFAQSLKAGQVPQTVSWMKRWLTAYPTTQNWRDALWLYGVQRTSVVKLDKSQQLDLLRLMRFKKALADQNDYELYAQWATDVGNPQETVAVIKEGKAAGKIPAGSASANDLSTRAAAAIKGDASLATLEAGAKSAANGLKASQTGDAYLGEGNTAKAIELYGIALQKGGVKADEVTTRLGIAKAMAGDTAGAKAEFAKVTTPPRQGIADWWTFAIDAPAATPAAAS